MARRTNFKKLAGRKRLAWAKALAAAYQRKSDRQLNQESLFHRVGSLPVPKEKGSPVQYQN